MKKIFPSWKAFPSSPSSFKKSLLKFHSLFLTLLLMLTVQSFSQSRTVTGRVLSQDAPVAGATVQVKGTSTATQTDNNGSFSISAPANGTLVISSVGYGNQEVAINGRSSVNVPLLASTQQLTDVVVVGYGTQKKVTVTGAVAAVRGAELDKSPGLNLSNSLAGRLPGVTAMQRSGEPGSDGSTIRIITGRAILLSNNW